MYLIVPRVLQALMPGSYLLPMSDLFHCLICAFTPAKPLSTLKTTRLCRPDLATSLEKEISRRQTVEVNNILR